MPFWVRLWILLVVPYYAFFLLVVRPDLAAYPQEALLMLVWIPLGVLTFFALVKWVFTPRPKP